MEEKLAPLQTVWLVNPVTVGVGLTVNVKLPVDPLQESALCVYIGVTVTVASTQVVPVFTPAKALIFPVPEAAKPIELVLFAQL